LFEKSFFIRTAMGDGTRHPLHDAFRRRTLPDQVDYSRDAAHDLVRLINGPHHRFAWAYEKFSGSILLPTWQKTPEKKVLKHAASHAVKQNKAKKKWPGDVC
jgi:hypothetical protein